MNFVNVISLKVLKIENLCQLKGDDERSILVKFWRKNLIIIFELLPFFDILNIANAISRKV